MDAYYPLANSSRPALRSATDLRLAILISPEICLVFDLSYFSTSLLEALTQHFVEYSKF